MILSALCPLLCNSTRPQHTLSLQMFADHCDPRQTIPWEIINRGLLQPQGVLYPIQTIFNHHSWDQLLEFRTSFYETISSEFLVQENFKHTQFSREHWYWRDSNLQQLASKANTVSIELTWLPNSLDWKNAHLGRLKAPRGELLFSCVKEITHLSYVVNKVINCL